MQIVEATIHRIDKRQHSEEVRTQTRERLLPINDTVTRVCEELLAMYAKKTDSQGSFSNTPDVDVFPALFDQYVGRQRTFHQLSLDTLALLSRRLQRVALANGGYVLFVRYTHEPNDFLLIAMLKQKANASIDDESLDLKDTLSIDLGLLNEAARVNITRRQRQDEPYLTFIKGPRRQVEITEYFRDALSCTNYKSSTEQTKGLIAALNGYVAQRDDLDENAKAAERIRARQRLHDCLRQNAEEISLATAAAAINQAEPQDFIDYVKAEVDGEPRYKFNDQFRPDKSIVRTLKRITGRSGTVHVSFDVADIQSQKVSYDRDEDVLIIREPGDALKDEVMEYDGGAAN